MRTNRYDGPVTQGFDNLLRRRIARWERRRELAEETQALAQLQQPTVAISRSAGSLGRSVARGVAENLGFDLFESELIDAIAESARVRAQVVESVGEHTQRHIVAWIDQQVQGGYFAETDYVQHLSKVVLSIGSHGDAVILGRGTHFVLDPARTLRVRVDANEELRVQRYVERMKRPFSEARKEIRRLDAERDAYCRRHFHRDVGDAHHYDLLLNTTMLSVNTCVKLVMEAFGSRFSQHGD